MRAVAWVTRAGVAALSAAALAGCGSSSLSAAQIRSRATKACTATARRTGKLSTPASPGGAVTFLNHGIAAIDQEVSQLQAMHATGTAKTAVDGTAAELAALRFTVKSLRADNDPVVAIKTLQARLAPIERRTNAAWRTLDVPACVTD
jgi:hypothetical protein